MSTIEKGKNVLTLVNIFTVDPDRQDQLVRLLVEAIERTMRHLPGFVSANIHRSLDGGKVINYAQWESMATFDAMRRNVNAQAHMTAAADLARYEAVFCEVIEAVSVR